MGPRRGLDGALGGALGLGGVLGRALGGALGALGGALGGAPGEALLALSQVLLFARSQVLLQKNVHIDTNINKIYQIYQHLITIYKIHV